jgi:signal transduction histidine kinase/CheY-like chemotaxis protein
MFTMESETRVLLVGAERVAGDSTAAFLERACDGVRTVQCNDPADATAHLRGNPVDCVVSGYRLPGTDGVDFCRTVQQAVSTPPPFVLVGENMDGDVVENAIAAGVTDHVHRRGDGTTLDVLANRVGNAAELARTRAQAAACAPTSTVVRRVTRRPVGLATDVTDRREREAQPEATTRALSRRTGTLKRFVKTIVDRELSFETRVARVLDLGRECFDMDVATVARVDDDSVTVEHVVTSESGVEPDDRFALDGSCCSLVVSADEPVGFHRPSSDARTRAVSHDRGRRSYLGAPIYAGDDRYGTLNVFSPDVRDEPFDDEERTVLWLFAQWLGSELARRRSRAHAKRHWQRLEAQKERLDEFESVVSHDIRSPLNVAKGRLELLREKHESEHIDGIDEGLSGIETLATDLLQLARRGKQVNDPSRVDLPDLIEECWRTVNSADATLHVETTRTVLADRSRLRQLVENLVRNAVEHREPTATVTVGDLSDGFYVADDGPGIPAENRDKLFDSGYTTQPEGTGIGLSIVRDIATAHGWTVTVTENAAGGARIEITDIDAEEPAPAGGTSVRR